MSQDQLYMSVIPDENIIRERFALRMYIINHSIGKNSGRMIFLGLYFINRSTCKNSGQERFTLGWDNRSTS